MSEHAARPTTTGPTDPRPRPFTPVTAPTRPPAWSTPRSMPARRSPRTASAVCAADSSTRAPATRPAPRWNRRWRPWRWPSYARAFSSGMAATDCALRALLRPGDHVVIPDDAYGGTFRLIDKVFTLWGISYTAVALTDLRRGARRHHRPHQADLGRDADQPAAVDRRHRARSPRWRRRRTQRCWWTTPSPRRRCSSRCRWAPTSCCTRRPSTSAGTPTWSAARC